MAKAKNSPNGNGRLNQRHRTRKDLLAAAGRLLQRGQTPDMDAIAKEAMVSRATAYRYFPTIESLLVEAPLDGAVPAPDRVFANDRSTDPAHRLETAEALLHEVTYRNEAQLRVMLAASLERKAKGLASDDIPVRQNRRMGLIEAALSPVRDRLPRATYEKLCASLALVFGTESMIVFNDVLGLDETTARSVKSWAMRALVNAAMAAAKQPAAEP